MLTPFKDATTGRRGLTNKNFGRSQQFMGMTSAQIPLNKIWTASLSLHGGYVINTSNEASGEFVNKGGVFAVQFQNNFTITPTLSADLTCFYHSRFRQGHFVIQPVADISVGLRKVLMQNKMTLSLTVSDILHTSKQRGSVKYENVNYSLVQDNDNRFVNLTMRYNFGSTTVRAARSRQTGIEDETTRAGGR